MSEQIRIVIVEDSVYNRHSQTYVKQPVKYVGREFPTSITDDINADVMVHYQKMRCDSQGTLIMEPLLSVGCRNSYVYFHWMDDDSHSEKRRGILTISYYNVSAHHGNNDDESDHGLRRVMIKSFTDVTEGAIPAAVKGMITTGNALFGEEGFASAIAAMIVTIFQVARKLNAFGYPLIIESLRDSHNNDHEWRQYLEKARATLNISANAFTV